MDEDSGWISIEFRLPGDRVWMKMLSRTGSREDQKRVLRRKWGNIVEIREQGSKEKLPTH